MATEISRPLLRGALFAAIGLAAIVIGAGYGIGGATAMGPGYFPVMSGTLLAIMGAADIVRGLRPAAEPFPRPHLWPVACLAAGVIGFGVLIDNGGLLLAVAVLAGFAFLAARRINPLEAVLLFTVLIALSGALFVFGLGRPFRDLLPH
jgi:Tripartite tricarboxylate transporter TctB family